MISLILGFSVINVSADSLTAPVGSSDTDSIIQQTPFYDPSCASSTSGGSTPSTTTGGSTGTGPAAWTSNTQAPYYIEDFVINVLQDIAQVAKVPESDTVTQEHVIGLVAWAYAEGGNIANTDVFNLWNTGINDPNLLASAAHGDGTQSFKSFDAGVTGATETITGSNQNRIEQVLTQPNTTAEQFVQALTYYQNYPGNHAWAEADVDNQQSYINTLNNVLAQTRANYASEASLEIGPGQEGTNHVPSSMLVYSGGTSSPTSSATSTTTSTSTSTSQTGQCNGASTSNSSATGSSSAACGGTTVTGRAAIACDALQYDPLSYSQGGHLLPSVWHQQCPVLTAKCATDCSGLVSLVIDDLYHVNKLWNTYAMVADKTNFEIIPFNEVQPGDFVQPDPGHVEIIETVNGNSLTTFAANTDKLPQPEQVGVGGTTTNLASNVYLRYIGTGAQ